MQRRPGQSDTLTGIFVIRRLFWGRWRSGRWVGRRCGLGFLRLALCRFLWSRRRGGGRLIALGASTGHCQKRCRRDYRGARERKYSAARNNLRFDFVGHVILSTLRPPRYLCAPYFLNQAISDSATGDIHACPRFFITASSFDRCAAFSANRMRQRQYTTFWRRSPGHPSPPAGAFSCGALPISISARYLHPTPRRKAHLARVIHGPDSSSAGESILGRAGLPCQLAARRIPGKTHPQRWSPGPPLL
jgi:hypothetical protein